MNPAQPSASGLDLLAGVARRQAHMALRSLRGRPPLGVPLGSMTLDTDDVALAHRWLASPDAGGTDEASAFEREFAAWNGSRHAFAFMSGREAFSAGLEALRLETGSEIIVPGYTCVVVPNAIEFAGLKPVYADIELETYGLDAARLAGRVSSRTRAVLIHHLYGLVCRDYDAIADFARSRGLALIEDCAQATGASYRGVRVGNRGDVAFYSSEQSKVFTTFQGGVAVANDDSVAARFREIRDRAPLPAADRTRRVLRNLILGYHVNKDPARRWRGDLARLRYGRDVIQTTTGAEEAGVRPDEYGCRMPAALAAIARNQLRKLDAYNERRRANATRWEVEADRRGFVRPAVIAGSTPVFLRYPVLADPERKRRTRWALDELGVNLGVWFVSHLHPTTRRTVNDCPNADTAVARCINFPTLFGESFRGDSM